MKSLNAILFAAFSLSGTFVRAQDFKPLFNGRDLDGWVMVNTPPQTWSVEDGMLLCTGKPIGELRTEQMFQNFELELEWRHMVPRGNAGVFVWADDITSRGVPFHRSIEVQVLENAYGNSQSHTTHGDIFPIHGATMTPLNGRGGSRAFPTEERSKPSPEWNHYRIVCQDGTISLAVNGKVVTQGKDASPRKGYICLESEGGVVHYRNIKIKVLPDTPVDAKDVAIANRGFRSLYSGLDLNGWKVPSRAEAAWKVQDWVLKFDGSAAESDARLDSSDSISCKGAIVDFRFVDGSKSLTIMLPGLMDPVVIQAGGDKIWSEALVARGQWNRIEFKFDGSGQLVLNGKEQPMKIDPSKTRGRLTLAPDGAVELANIYVR